MTWSSLVKSQYQARACYRRTTLARRLQVVIGDECWARLEREGERKGISVSVLVREALGEAARARRG